MRRAGGSSPVRPSVVNANSRQQQQQQQHAKAIQVLYIDVIEKPLRIHIIRTSQNRIDITADHIRIGDKKTSSFKQLTNPRLTKEL